MRDYSNLSAKNMQKAHDELIAELANLVGANDGVWQVQILQRSVIEIKRLKSQVEALKSMLDKSCGALYEIAELLEVNVPDEPLTEIAEKAKKELERRA